LTLPTFGIAQQNSERWSEWHLPTGRQATGDATWFDKLTTKSRLPKNITKISKNLLRYILQLVSELAFPFQGSNAFYAL